MPSRLGAGETKEEFVEKCISVRQDEHPEENVQQSVAICHSMYREKKKKKKK